MIALDPPRIDAACPDCDRPLAASGWLMPGMRALARTQCTGCGEQFLIDLPVGQAIWSPMILRPADGSVVDRVGVPWFADWLRRSYRDRIADTPAVAIESHRPVTRPVALLNCLDPVYGHALLKLLNAQAILDDGGHDLIVLAARGIGDLIPDGVAESWLVDWPIAAGGQWSDGIAAIVARETQRLGEVMLAPAHSHPHPSAITIARFSRVPPFDVARWPASERPAITFVWRDDRTWPWTPRYLGQHYARRRQRQAVVTLFGLLRQLFPQLDAAVVGLGRPGGLPDTIADLRSVAPDRTIERTWLERFARSHVVIGVQGSNMLLPSAHAGAMVEILDHRRRDNFLQDVLFNGDDPRDLMFRYRFLPPGATPTEVAAQVRQIVARYRDFTALMPPRSHDDVRD